METVQVLIQVPRDRIGLVTHLIEGYDGLALVRTENAPLGILCLLAPESRAGELRSLLDDLALEVPLRSVPEGDDPASLEPPPEWKHRRSNRPSARSRRKRKRRRLLGRG